MHGFKEMKIIYKDKTRTCTVIMSLPSNIFHKMVLSNTSQLTLILFDSDVDFFFFTNSSHCIKYFLPIIHLHVFMNTIL